MRDEQVFFGDGCGCEHDDPVNGGADERTAAADAAYAADVAGADAAAAASRRRFLRTAAFTVLGAPALLASACSAGGKSSAASDQLTSPATSTTSPGAGTDTAGGGASSSSSTSGSAVAGGGPETADAALLARKYQGLKPFAAAPPPPAVKPVNTNVPLPPVVDHIPGLPADQRICFLTIDDGAEKDPVFLEMVKDFKVPITLFLTDQMIKDDYSYFAKLKATGHCTIQNHTLTHPNLVQATPARQHSEVAGQQAKLITEYGTTPYLFRAPYGNSNQVTQQACKESGLKALMYWRATFQKQGFQWQAADKKLRPGDILLSHFRGPKAMGAGWPEMHQLMINLFHIVQEQGYTFARLEDYV